MRFDTPIFFQRTTPGEYNPDTGNYEADTVTEDKKYANITDTGTETMSIVYGSIRQGSKVVRLQNHYKASFDLIRIGSKVYRVDYSRELWQKHVFVVSEVQ